MHGGHGIIWTQFILAAALDRLARTAHPLASDGADTVFAYADTHAGSGRLDKPAALALLLAQTPDLASRAYLDALAQGGVEGGHPGSWILAARVLTARGMAVESDVNDIDPIAIAAGQPRREAGWTRFWSHDWFLFLRERLSRAERPDFVFIDPPADDPRGPGYAIDAAILLDTLGVPYMVSYPLQAPQASIDEIGRSGLELRRSAGESCGVLLGGGAEAVVLDVLGDLKVLAALLGGDFTVRLPRPPVDDYCI